MPIGQPHPKTGNPEGHHNVKLKPDTTTSQQRALTEVAQKLIPDPTKLKKSNAGRDPGSPSPNLSKRQTKFLNRQLAKFGYPTLFHYLLSEHWRDLKERYFATVHLTGENAGYWTQGMPQTCVVCKDANADLHHRTYSRLGEERLHDLVALCRFHHDQLHAEGLDLFDGPGILYDLEVERRTRVGRQFATAT